MKTPIRLYFSILATAALIVQVVPLPNAQAEGDAHLAQSVTSSSPASGESLALDSVVSFDPSGGHAVIDPNTEFAETFSYTGTSSESNTLVGLDRPNPQDHSAGAVVQIVSGASPSPSPTLEPSEEPESDSTPSDDPSSGGQSDDQASEGGSSEGSPESEPSSEDASSDPSGAEAIPHPCLIIEEETGRDLCGMLVGEVLPDSCMALDLVQCVIDVLNPDMTPIPDSCEHLDVVQCAIDVVDPDLIPLPEDPNEAIDLLEAVVVSIDNIDNDLEFADSEGAVDIVWDAAAGLGGDGDCRATAHAPQRTGSGPPHGTKGTGTLNCGEEHDAVTVCVVLQIKSGGVWKRWSDTECGPAANTDHTAVTAEGGCKVGEKWYRTKAQGAWRDLGDAEPTVTPVDKAKAEIFCPAPRVPPI